jgi:hypothetical protein
MDFAIDLVECALLTARTGSLGTSSTPERDAEAEVGSELLCITSGAVVGEAAAAGVEVGETVVAVAAGVVEAGAAFAGAGGRSSTGPGCADAVEDLVAKLDVPRHSIFENGTRGHDLQTTPPAAVKPPTTARIPRTRHGRGVGFRLASGAKSSDSKTLPPHTLISWVAGTAERRGAGGGAGLVGEVDKI